MRIGTKVRIVSLFDLALQGKTGTITRVNVPGQTSKSGTAGFKYVKLENGTVQGFFTRELERVKS